MDLGAGGKPPSRRADEPAGVCGQLTVSQGQACLSWPAPRALEGVPASQPHCGARPGWGTPSTQRVWLHTGGGGWKKLWLKTTNNLGHRPRWGEGDTPEERGAHHHQDPPKPGTWPQPAFEER